MKCLSFFSGCLGLDTGLKLAGIEHLLFCEIDKYASSTIKLNNPNVPLIDDILDFDAVEIRKIAGLSFEENIDLIVGGPPCQAFSTAGKRASFQDPRGNVFLHFIDLISQLKPRYFVIENVRGLLSAALKHRPHSERGLEKPPLALDEMPGGALAEILKVLSSEGYKISFNLYNTANFGVPQKRERVIIIGTLNDKKVPHLIPTNSEKKDYELPPWRTFRDVAQNLEEKDAEFINFSKNRVKFYEFLKEGQYWRDLPDEIKIQAMGKSLYSGGGKTGFYRRIYWDKPTPTLVTHPAMPATDLCHPEIIRPLSVQEYKRVQQFPDDFLLFGNTLQKYKQLGNAVPVGFGKLIGEHLINHSRGNEFKSNKYTNFPYSRYKNTSDENWNNIVSSQLSLKI